MDFVELIKYVCFLCGEEGKIPLRRLVKILFLIDWRSAIESNKQITPIEWVASKGILWANKNLKSALDDSEELIEVESYNELGAQYKEIALTSETLKILAGSSSSYPDMHVIQKISALANKCTDEQLYRLVYSTYPVMTVKDGEAIDLIRIAQEYLSIQEDEDVA